MATRVPKIGEIFEKRYKLLEVLGSGGVGTLFKTQQTDSGRLIALKILQPHIVVEEEFRVRFLREAQALNKLQHENIVTVYHLGLSDSGLPYLAMELIDGVPLRKILVEIGKFSEQRTLRIMLQVCRALTCMHEAGIIHRDLKPDNIMILQEPEPDTVKIIDFGLVKMDSDTDQKLTATGVLIGSVNYMSPEQCRGEPVDARSDIYAAAVCMYEMLSGQPPFIADNAVGVMYGHVNQKPPELILQPSTGTKLIQSAILEALAKGLEKDPINRFQSAAEMHNALSEMSQQEKQQLQQNRSSTAKTTLSKFARPLPIALVLVFLVLLLLGSAQIQKLQKPKTTSASDRETSHKVDDSASVHLPVERTDSAELLLKKSLARDEKALGAVHPKVAADLLDLGTYYLQHQKWELAEHVLKRSLAISQTSSGQKNIVDTVAVLQGLGISYMERGRFGEAEPFFKRAISTCQKEFGAKDAQVAVAMVYLATDYCRQDNYTKAEPLLKQAVSINGEVYEPYAPSVAEPLILLADCYIHKGRCKEAEPLLARSLIIKENEFGPSSSTLSYPIKLLADCYKQQGKDQEARQLLKRAQGIKQVQDKSE